MIVYLGIGNSDDKLSQVDWSDFNSRIAAEVTIYASKIHGAWGSHPAARWQNACWCLEFSSSRDVEAARQAATEIRREFGQDSLAWAVVEETEFI